MDKPERFTLREEYFGGIVHDVKEMNCHILNSRQYGLLSMILDDTEVIPIREYEEIGYDKSEIEKFADMGILTIESDKMRVKGARKVKQLPIKNGCLAAPIRVYHTFTRKCNLKCPQCCIASEADTEDDRMTMEEFESVVRKFYEAGTMEWRFTGGEATFCQDLPEAVSIVRKYGMAVMLNTNGCWSEKLTQKLLHAGLAEVIVSMEGSEPVNELRRPGAYRKTIKTLGRISKYNKENPGSKIRVTINMTVAKDNVKEVEFVVRLGADYGFNVNFVPLRPYGRTPSCLPETMLSTEEFMEFSRKVQKLREAPEIKSSGIKIVHRNMDLFCPDYPDKSDNPYPFNYSDCGALSTGFGLCPDGRVNVCSFLMDDPEFLGPNMTEVSVQEAWLHPKVELFRRAKKLGCGNCRFYMNQCEGKCRAMVLAEGGRIDGDKLIGSDRYCFSRLMSK